MRRTPFSLTRVFVIGTTVSLLVLLSAELEASPIVGQTDTFSTASTLGWSNGNAPAPLVISTGGPAGVGDGYLQITADGSGVVGRLTAFNRSQWAGDFLSAGVAAVEMDLRNFGSSPLSIRIGLKESATIDSPGFASTVGFSLPVDGLWHHATFLLDTADLTRFNSTTLLLDTLLSNVAELRILHSAAPSLTGDPIVSQLGVDNIKARAAAVPEPSALLLLTAGLVALGRSKKYVEKGPANS
jgi:PEP-CTERM motif